ncbi:GNAT family N-acetyltransferase [Chengkuizengella axinellae]|uniref:GNAT family protein n=1 Tax=Chengkuizengella axinellae TaxID=3064388 RepID=A0ABT9J342_9BACL|nr:GNAT family protein [Chengkuizengella sp. 2205SS18-9]MDP5275414.1 GNAT family protein [Chengkuizengella sp. 2205SS18-9]
MDFPILETTRLDLVKIDKEHVQAYYEIMSKSEVTQYYGMDSLKNIEEAAKIIEFFENSFESKRGIRWAMILKETNQFIGTLGLNSLNMGTKKSEIGYEIHPSYWGKGITAEALTEVLTYSFQEFDLFRIGAVTFPDNIASNRLLEKLGFTNEGKLRGYLYQNEQPHDAFIYSILKTEWEEKQREI